MILFDSYDNGASFNVTKDEPLTVISHQGIIDDIKINSKFTVGEEAVLKIYNVITSQSTVEINQEVNIIGENANVEVINVLLGSHANIVSNISINHHVASSESNFSNYAIALDDTKMLLNNNGKIDKGAHKSVVHQKAKGLTLGKSSEIKAQPNLFIDDYDVVANHACAIGSINKDDLFYLTSRGLTSQEATQLIVVGFIKPIIDKINDEKIVKVLNDDFNKILNER